MTSIPGIDLPSQLQHAEEIEALSQTERPVKYAIDNVQSKLFTILSKIPNGLHFGFGFTVCRPGTQDWALLTNGAPGVQAPTDPGLTPTIPNATPVLEERRLVREHEARLKVWRDYQAVLGWLMTQLVRIFGIYIAMLRNRITGYATITPQRCFAHMYATYGKMTDALLEANLTKLKDPFDPFSEQIEGLISRQLNIQQVAAHDEPISNHVLIRTTKSVIAATGYMPDAVREWDAKMEAHKTWDRFVTHFTDAYVAFMEGPVYNAGPSAKQLGQANAAKAEADPSFVGYCWTHGLTFDPAHTSATCRSCAPNHKREATLFNMMGGCARLTRRKGEVAVYKRPERKPRGNNGSQTSGNQE